MPQILLSKDEKPYTDYESPNPWFVSSPGSKTTPSTTVHPASEAGRTASHAAAVAKSSAWREDFAASTARFNRGGGSYSGIGTPSSQAMRWTPQAVKSSTTTATRAIGELPELPEYEELDEDKTRSRTQEFSALGRRIARSNFQDLLSRVYGATPDDPYAKDLARKASQGFSIDVQRAISEGGREALSVGLQEQQTRNQRQMTAYQAAVNAVLATGTTTTKQEYEYAPTPMQALPTAGTYREPTTALATRYDPNKPLSLGQPYTYG